jgi:hypothetical protein
MISNVYAEAIHLPKQISKIDKEVNLVRIVTQSSHECIFEVSKNFGLNNSEEVSFLIALNQNRNLIQQDCEARFLVPYDINFLWFNGKYNERRSLIPLSYLAIYQLMYLALQQDSYAAENLIFNRENFLNIKTKENKFAYSAEIAEFYYTEVLYSLYMFYDEIGSILKKLSKHEYESLAKNFFFTLEIGNPCENKDYIIEVLQKLEKKKEMNEFIEIIKKDYSKQCQK